MGKLADQILAAEDRPSKAVEVPEWGVTVYVRPMSGTERDAWEVEQYFFNQKGKAELNRKNIRTRLLVQCLVDELGEKLFSTDQVAALGAKSGKVLDRLYDQSLEACGLRTKDVEELAKN